MAEALAALAGDAPRRQVLGRLNQERVKAEYSLEPMIAAYRALLGARGGAAGNASLLHRATAHPHLLHPLSRCGKPAVQRLRREQPAPSGGIGRGDRAGPCRGALLPVK